MSLPFFERKDTKQITRVFGKNRTRALLLVSQSHIVLSYQLDCDESNFG